MCYHYETQPVPNPFSYFLHFSPVWWHKFETMMNHIVELPLPFLILLPVTGLVAFGGMVQILFQITLILSGNLSFLNWLTRELILKLLLLLMMIMLKLTLKVMLLLWFGCLLLWWCWPRISLAHPPDFDFKSFLPSCVSMITS